MQVQRITDNQPTPAQTGRGSSPPRSRSPPAQPLSPASKACSTSAPAKGRSATMGRWRWRAPRTDRRGRARVRGRDRVEPTSRGSGGDGRTIAGATSARAARSSPLRPCPGRSRRPVPRFTLLDVWGGSFFSARPTRRPYVLTFLYVHCVDVCPLIGSEIHGRAAKLGAQAGKLNVVGISVEPRGDTRPVVVAAHEPADFHYLIGSPRQLAPVWKAFYVSPQTPGNPRSTHTAVDPADQPRPTSAALVPARSCPDRYQQLRSRPPRSHRHTMNPLRNSIRDDSCRPRAGHHAQDHESRR